MSINNAVNLCRLYGVKYDILKTNKVGLSLSRSGLFSKSKISAIIIDASHLEFLNQTEINILSQFVTEGKIYLLIVGSSSTKTEPKGLRYLTEFSDIRFDWLKSSNVSYNISSNNSEISREFTGVQKDISSGSEEKKLVIKKGRTRSDSERIISIKSGSSEFHPIFIKLNVGNGLIFIAASCIPKDSCQRLSSLFNWKHFSALIPTMMFIRYSCGIFCWHRNENF
ncbi:MAG: hypothetical protein ACE5H1_11830, partial [Thermodesulfobacteriota bacterium]